MGLEQSPKNTHIDDINDNTHIDDINDIEADDISPRAMMIREYAFCGFLFFVGITMFAHANYTFSTIVSAQPQMQIKDIAVAYYWTGIVPGWVYAEETLGMLSLCAGIIMAVVFGLDNYFNS